jgi:hypothetical protein
LKAASTGDGCGSFRSEVVFHFRLDFAVAHRVADAEQGESLRDLVVIQKALVLLVHLAGDDAAGTGAAGTGAAGIGKLNALLLGGLEDIGGVRALEALAGGEFDLEGGHRKTSCLSPFSPETLALGVTSRTCVGGCSRKPPMLADRRVAELPGVVAGEDGTMAITG